MPTSNPEIYWGQDAILELTLSRLPEYDGSLVGANLRFDLGLKYGENPIQTVLNTDITRDSEAAEQLELSLQVDGAALQAALTQEKRHTLKWQVLLSPLAGGQQTFQGSLVVLPAY
ncbi:MAG: hypothetical protein AAGF24_04815 [Cyanobacteria bacterium P01_H01_bin.121]